MSLSRMQLKILQGSAALLLTIFLLLINVKPALGVDFTLTVNKGGTGTVTSNPPGIDCGTTCSFDFTETTVVTLTATHPIGSYFAGWSGGVCSGTDTCVVTMDAAKSVTATFTADTVRPTAAITYSVAGPYKSGTSVTITATFSEAMADSPVPQISISGANTLAATDMTKSSATVYTYAYTVGSGNGPATVAMSTGTDMAGNIVISLPTSGATFTVDNTPPSFSSVAPITGANINSITTSSDVSYTLSEAIASGTIKMTPTGGTFDGSTHTCNLVGAALNTGAHNNINLSVGCTVAPVLVSGAIYRFDFDAADAAGNLAATVSSTGVTFDNTAPTLSPVSIHSNNANNAWAKVGDTVTVTFTSSENITTPTVTIASSAAIVSGGPTIWSAARTMLTADTAGTLAFSIAFSDLAGNAGVPVSTTTDASAVTFDKTAPTIGIGAPSALATQSGPVTYLITYVDTNFNTSTLAVGNITLNRSGTANGTVGVDAGSGSSRTVTISAITGDGTLGITIAAGTAGDMAGNLAPASGSSTTFTVDNTVPIITIANPTTTPAKSKTITASTSEGTLTMSNTTGSICDGTLTFLPYSSQTFTLESNNGLKVCYKAVDNAGNTVYNLSNAIAGIDTTAPTAAITYSVAGPYASGALVTITATFSEAMLDSPVPQISISGANTLAATNMTKSSTTIYTYAYTVGSGNGTATVAMGRGTDLAGNVVISLPTSGATFTVDNIAPIITITNPTTTPAKSKTITASTSEGTLTMSNTTGSICDGTLTFLPYSSQTFTSESNNGLKVCYKAVDNAGNTAYNLSNAIAGIDTTAPTISIGAPSVSATKNGPVTYTVTYADAHFNASTLAPANITLNKTGDATGSLGVTGSGLTRTVTINNISGNGTLGISIAAATASDTAGNLAPAAGPSTTFAVDTTLPSLSWIYPPPCGSPPCYYSVSNQRIQLTVAASDIVGISKVVFRRWDKNALVWVDITTLYNSPYSFSFDTTTLLPEWNQITARAYDTANNITESYIFLNLTPLWLIDLPLIHR